MAGFEDLGAYLDELLGICLIGAGLDALLGDGADGPRAVCGLCAALCVARMAAAFLG